MDIKQYFTSKKGHETLKAMLQSQAVLIGLLVLSLLPMTVVTMRLLRKNVLLKEGVARMEFLVIGAKKTALLRKKQRLRLEQYNSADPMYIQKYLEAYAPQQKEIDLLTAFTGNESLHHCAALTNRLEALKEKNLLQFVVEKEAVSKEVMESELSTVSPVEMSDEDVKKVLSRIEGIKIGSNIPPIGRPELVLKEFNLKRVRAERKGEVFEVDMKVIKREGVRG